MAHITFVIPHNKSELIEETDEQYYVKDVIGVKELRHKLIEARQCLRDDGPAFIIEYFDTYFSVLQHGDCLPMDILIKAYQDLHKATRDLNENIGFVLQDKDILNDELKLKYVNILKMLFYIYTNIVNLIEAKDLMKRKQNFQDKKRKQHHNEGDTENIDKQSILIVMNNIMQREISVFWDPPFVDEGFINLIAEVCYKFLENPIIKHEKDIRREIFCTLGIMLKSYSHGVTFVVRVVQLIKTYEHIVSCVAEGIELLITNYNCKSLVRDFIREVTEWQADEQYQDSQGTKHCSIVLTEMAVLMPALMIPEVMYLNRYLAHESYTLRNSVLNVITEVIITILTKSDLSDEEQGSRDEFLAILEEHIYDTSAHVRSKIIQYWIRLQKENAIPVKLQVTVLGKIVLLLKDKSALVRKNVVNCVTSFLTHNSFGAKLELVYIEKQLCEYMEALDTLRTNFEKIEPSNFRKIEEEWSKREGDIKDVIENNLDAKLDEVNIQLSKKDFVELIQMYITEGKYKDAFILCRTTSDQCNELNEDRDKMERDKQVNFYLGILRGTFYDCSTRVDELAASLNVNADNLQKLETVQDSITYFEQAKAFLKLIESVIKVMVRMLKSNSINDMQEAVQFFIAAYNFSIDNARLGLMEMLNIMKRPEQDRKDVVVNAFKTIFLMTDAKNLSEHTQMIVNRLCNLVKNLPYEYTEGLKIIIVDWIKNGVLDNSVIDMLWQYFTKKVDVTDEQSLLAVYLLTMAAMGRKTIVMRNIKLVTGIACGERGANDLVLFAAACKLLAVGGYEKPSITDQKLPFKIKHFDPIWESLLNILFNHFMKRTPFFNNAVTNAIEFIYKLCSKPDVICEQLIDGFLANFCANDTAGNMKVDNFVLMRCNHVLGEIAIKHLNFLDESVYKELKRRNHIREERKNAQKGINGRQKVKKNYRNPTACQRLNSLHNSNSSELSGLSVAQLNNSQIVEESTLEGALADDADAEVILDILENATVTGSAGLAKLAPFIVKVCENYATVDDVYLLSSSIIALLRYMIVSSKFCVNHVQLIFTILERTPHSEIKCTILVHLSDLLERFPNIIEPWTPRIYESLRNSDLEFRKTAFYILANLILRDMILIRGQISSLAICLVDDDDVLKNMSRSFFTLLATRANHLYNVLPDIFSHLSDEKDLSERDFRYIMKFLFSLIDKNKQMESLVDRFSQKFVITQNAYGLRNIAYCLSLIQYSEKGLKRLLDNFPHYKEHLQNSDVYATFKQLLNTCNKNTKAEIKALTVEIEERINSAFEVDEGENEGMVTPSKNKMLKPTAKSSFKKPRGRPNRITKRTKNMDSSSDSD